MGLFRHKTPRLLSKRIAVGEETGLTSIVLPVYNGEKYLAEAIESVLAQTKPLWELLVIDDGSTDASAAIAKQYAARDKRIRVWQQENQKLPQALNRGFSLARGEFYTWLSADNRFLPDFLEVMTKELLKHADADMVFGNQYLLNAAGERIVGHGWFEFPPKSGAVCFPPATPALNTVANNTIGAAFLYRAGAEAVLGGYSPQLFLLEDYDYFMRMNSLFRIRHIRRREPIYEYRMHPDSLTSHDAELHITDSRPKLMAFDAYRRREYRQKEWVNLQGFPLKELRMLRKNGVFPTDAAEHPLVLWKEREGGHEGSYQVVPKEKGYLICHNKEPLAMLRTRKEMARFLRLRLLSDRVRKKELEIF